MRILMGLFFAAPAWACPNLTGTYVCSYQDGSSKTITVAQEDRNGTTVYNYDATIIPADNQNYAIEDDDNLKSGVMRAWCDNNGALQAQLTGKYFRNTSYFGDLDMTLTFALVNSGLRQASNGTLQSEGSSYPIATEQTCARSH